MTGPEIKALRERLGLTQQQFSERYCVPLVELRNWERGRRQPDPVTTKRLTLIANPHPNFIVKITRPRGGATRAPREITDQRGALLAELPADFCPSMRLGQFTAWAWASFDEDGELVLGKPAPPQKHW